MNPIAKKKTTPPKTKAKATSVVSQHRGRQTAPVILAVESAQAVNGSSQRTDDRQGYEDYLIYKQLKEEVDEFYSHPGLWLESPHPMLGGQTPLQLALSSPGGKEIVWNLIQMIKAGMFS